MLALVILEGFVLLLLVVLVAGLLRSHADILRTLHDLGVGDHEPAPAPASGQTMAPGVAGAETPGTGRALDIVGQRPGGGQRKVAVVGTDHPTLVAFLSSGCLTCAEFWHQFEQPEALDLPGEGTQVVIVTKSPGHESESAVSEQAPSEIPTIMSDEAWDHYRVPGSPYFVLVDGPTGTVLGEGSGTTWHQVSSLLRSALADRGLDLEHTSTASRNGPAREARADEELRRAGVRPGHPSLYPTTTQDGSDETTE